jgi:peptidoglycan-N-acetylglucosamine deacetylase
MRLLYRATMQSWNHTLKRLPLSHGKLVLAVVVMWTCANGPLADAQTLPDTQRPQAGLVPALTTAPSQPSLNPRPPRTGTVKREPATPQPASGCGSPGAIGVSRVHEIDTSIQPRFGHQQYKELDFLKDGEVVLTFDDGPLRPYTIPVLKALDAHCTKATFFVVGRMAIADPELVKDTARRGHTIGTHTWSHMDLRKIGPSRARGELELGISAVGRALGKPVAPFFRFPFLSDPKNMRDYAQQRGIGVFSIEVDSNDYRTKNPEDVNRNVLSQLQTARKGIILFHDIQPSTAGALKGLLDTIKARGFKVVHLVASNTTKTLPEFDAMADKEMSRKSKVAASDPLANRSVVWPVTGGDNATPPSLPPSAPPRRPGTVARGPEQAAAPASEVLPWGVTAVKPAPPTSPQPAAPAARPRREREEPSFWPFNPFGN